ncbi:hypothetical protein OAS39_11240 [Pirellulales bacterium]|nr:hypothetical protein [Pirellulales bacterium]
MATADLAILKEARQHRRTGLRRLRIGEAQAINAWTARTDVRIRTPNA